MNAGVWLPLLPHLEQFNVTVVELPGHGRQAWVEGGTSLQSWCDSVLSQAPERAVRCGWSLGGQVALQAALNHPDRVSSLLMIAATPCFTLRPDWSHGVPAEVFDQFARQLSGDIDGTLKRFLTLQTLGTRNRKSDLARLRSALDRRPRARAVALEAGLDLLLDNDLRQQLAQVEQPQLWLQGERDALVPETATESIGELVRNGRVEIVSGAAHAPFLSHPDHCAREITGFLRHV